MHCLIAPAGALPSQASPDWLDALLARSREIPEPDPDPLDPHSPAERLQGRLAGLPEDAALPLAAWTLGDDQLPWAFLSPVHLQIETNQVVALPQSALQLQEAESRALFDSLSELFPAHEGWQLRWLDPLRWAIGHEQLDGLRLASLERAVNRPLTPWLPEDKRIRRWTNEVQMLWHGHAVNSARAWPVNSIWWWGAGRALQPRPPLQLENGLALALEQQDPQALAAAWEALRPRLQAANGELSLAGERRLRRFALGARRWWQRRGPRAAEVLGSL